MHSLNRPTLLDENIAERAFIALWQHPFLDPQGLELVVMNGVVSLMGVDIDPATVATACTLLDDLPGVQAVVDATVQNRRLAA